MTNEAPVPDWNKIHPDLNAKYSDLLQSHHSLCSEIERLKEEHKAFYDATVKAGLEQFAERDRLVLQNSALKDALAKYGEHSRRCGFIPGTETIAGDVKLLRVPCTCGLDAVLTDNPKNVCQVLRAYDGLHCWKDLPCPEHGEKRKDEHEG